MQRVHIIAVGSPAMADLAIAVSKKNNYLVTGSDIEISGQVYERLKKNNILPEKNGWHPELIHKNLNAVVTGIDVTEDNPELMRAKELNLKILSYPEFLFVQTRSKTRIVVSGSYGKSTIVAMILHVLRKLKIDNDYLTGTSIKGVEDRVRLTYDARIAVFEGDESLTSPVDKRPKFHLYKPHIAVITGIQWDHANIFSNPEEYAGQFSKFIELMEIQGRLIYFNGDSYLNEIATKLRRDVVSFDYNTPEYEVSNGITCVKYKNKLIPLKIFGEYNLQNLNAARLALRQVGVNDEQFYNSITDFESLENHMELLKDTGKYKIYRDIAESPGKLKASVNAVKDRYPDIPLVALYEIHSIGSFYADFINSYNNSLEKAEIVLLYINPKKITDTVNLNEYLLQIEKTFSNNNCIFTNTDDLKKKIKAINPEKHIFLFNTSESFPVEQIVNYI